MIQTQRWFDDKYSGGGMPTLEDKAELFRTIPGIHFQDRTRREIKEALQEHLFAFEARGGYTPSLHAKTHQLLFCVAPLAGFPSEELQEYVTRYEKALKRHDTQNVFKQNYASPSNTRE